MPRARSAVTVGEWIKLARSVQEVDMEAMPQLKGQSDKLAAFIEEVRKVERERDFHAAQKQEATRRLREMLEAGNRVATTVRMILKIEKGPTSEELTQFGIQPFRGRKRRRKDGSGEAPKESPEASRTETP